MLEKLIEIKELKAYIDLRVRRLKEELSNINKYPEKKRNSVIERIRGRITEINRLKGMICQSKVKSECKKMWKHQQYEKDKTKARTIV